MGPFCKSRVGIDPFSLSRLWGLRKRTPGPPFSSMNSTPAPSKARRIAKSFAAVNAVTLSFNSARRRGPTLQRWRCRSIARGTGSEVSRNEPNSCRRFLMSSLRQIAANRRNVTKSTGPRTEEGKQRSRCNAVRHGLTAETVIGALEDAED